MASPVAPSDVAGVVHAGWRLFDLDSNPVTVDGALARDPVLRRLVRTRRAFACRARSTASRSPSAPSSASRSRYAALGRSPDGWSRRPGHRRPAGRAGGITHLFPTAEHVATASFDGIGLTGRRAATLRQLSELVAGGDLDLSGHGDPEVALDKLLAIPGVGGWTASYVAMRALRDPDAFPATDLGIRAA